MFHTQDLPRAAFLALLLAATPVAEPANDTSDCPREAIRHCADVVESGRWYERFGVGVICLGMFAGCAIESMP